MNTDKQIEDKIDLISIIKVLWKSKKLFIEVCSIALLIGVIVSFSIPKTKHTRQKLFWLQNYHQA